MPRRVLIPLLLALALGVPAGAQQATKAPPPAPERTVVVLHTTLGDIHIALETRRAPITSQNFLRYVDAGRFDGTTFYRALSSDRAGREGLVQGGLQGKTRGAFPPIAHESTLVTGLSHTDGAVSMASPRPGAARGEFFIVVGDMSTYDAVPDGGNAGFAVFGRVVSGMPLVRKMLKMPRSKQARSFEMEGQMLAEPVTILTARRAP